MITPQDPQNILAQELAVTSLYFKHEDKHPLLSHKGRSIPFMIDHYIKQGKRAFALSSSGNAALAAALHIKSLNEQSQDTPFKLEIFIGMHINETKVAALKKLADEHITITQTERPLQTLFTVTKEHGDSLQQLRQSNDPIALEGYRSLAEELLEIKDLEAIFIPTSSGTTAEALGIFFKENKRNVQIHIVQTMSCHPLASQFTDILQTEEISLADAIVDKTALRSPSLTPIIKTTNGNGWIVTNEEIEDAQEITKRHTGITLSANSALSVAGLMQAVYSGTTWKGSVVCLITGK